MTLSAYGVFDDPVMRLYFMDAGLCSCSYLDYGSFLQSLRLAAEMEWLATGPQAVLAEYPQIVKAALAFPEGGDPRLWRDVALAMVTSL